MYIVIIHINNLAITPTTFKLSEPLFSTPGTSELCRMLSIEIKKHLEAQTMLFFHNSCIPFATCYQNLINDKPPFAPPDPRPFLLRHQDLSTTEEVTAVTDENSFCEAPNL
jgi:hypothetical protein